MDYLVVDFEFTFYKKSVGRPRTFFSEIIEIGAVKFIGDSLKQKCKLQNFVQPKFFPRHAGDAMEFCMITPRDMESAIAFLLNRKVIFIEDDNILYKDLES